MSASSSAEVTQGCFCRKAAFSMVMVSFWLLSKGCSSARNTSPPATRYSTTTTNTASTVFHFMTVKVAVPSATASMLATMLAGRDNDCRCAEQPMGFCMVATLAWTRLDCNMLGWTFFGGMRFVCTGTEKDRGQRTKISHL